MAQAPVAKLVGENSNDLLGLALLDQSVVDDNVLLPGKTKEVGIAVGAALASINDVELVEGEVEFLGETLDLRLELALLQGGQLVEERQNGNRVDGDHEDLESGAKQPEVVEELVTSLLDDGEETREDGRGQDDSDEVGLDHVRDEQLGRLLVEAKLFLENKGLVDVGRERQNLADEHEGQDEDDGMRDLAREASGCKAEEQVAGP